MLASAWAASVTPGSPVAGGCASCWDWVAKNVASVWVAACTSPETDPLASFLQAGVAPEQVAKVLNTMVSASAPDDVHAATRTLATFFASQAQQLSQPPATGLPGVPLAAQADASKTVGAYLAKSCGS